MTRSVGKREHLRQVAYHHLMTHLFCPPLNLVGEGGRGDEGQRRIEMQNIVGSQGILPS